MNTIEAKKTIADNSIHRIESFIVASDGFTIGYISGINGAFGHFYYSNTQNKKNIFEYHIDNINDFIRFPIPEHDWLWITIALQLIKRKDKK